MSGVRVTNEKNRVCATKRTDGACESKNGQGTNVFRFSGVIRPRGLNWSVIVAGRRVGKKPRGVLRERSIRNKRNECIGSWIRGGRPVSIGEWNV